MKVYPQALLVELGELYLNRIAELESRAGAFTNEHALPLAVNIIIAVEIFDVNQTLDEYVIELNKETDGTHIDNGCVETLAYFVFQIENLHKPNRIPLGLLRGDFALRRQIANIGQTTCAACQLIGIGYAIDRIAQDAVKNQIGVAANGRCEMRISIAGQSKMTAVVGGVNCFFQ